MRPRRARVAGQHGTTFLAMLAATAEQSRFTREDGKAFAQRVVMELQRPQRVDDAQAVVVAPSVNVIQQCLDRLRELGSREVEEGFTGALVDFLSSTAGRGVREVSGCDRASDIGLLASRYSSG